MVLFLPIYRYQSDDGQVIEEFFPISSYPRSIERDGKVFTLTIATPSPAIMPVESPLRYQQWFHSESVQERLRTGEYQILPKSDDANQ